MIDILRFTETNTHEAKKWDFSPSLIFCSLWFLIIKEKKDNDENEHNFDIDCHRVRANYSNAEGEKTKAQKRNLARLKGA